MRHEASQGLERTCRCHGHAGKCFIRQGSEIVNVKVKISLFLDETKSIGLLPHAYMFLDTQIRT